MKEEYLQAQDKRTQTYYSRDAGGNILGIYQWVNNDTLQLSDLVMYGSSRLGTIFPDKVMYVDSVLHDSVLQVMDTMMVNAFDSGIVSHINGLKQYELNNHLGNVLTTLTDRHIPQYVSSAFNHYEAEVATAQDYYPFGMLMPGRTLSANDSVYTVIDTVYPCVVCLNFDPGLTGWYETDTSVHIAYVDGSMQIITQAPWEGAELVINTEPGQTYTLEAGITFGEDYVNAIEIWDSTGFFLLDGIYVYDSLPPYTFTFMADEYNTRIKINKAGGSSIDTFYVDSLIIKSTLISSIDTVDYRIAKSGYRFGFNGHEKDDEIKGTGNWYAFGDYGYDPRVVQRPSPDPLAHKYPYVSPYAVFGNNPIRYIDPTGMAPENPIDPIGPGYYQATVNARMIAFSTRHPIAAALIGTPSKGSINISTNAVRFSTRIGLNENAQHEGSQVNAFRHVLWQAEIAQEFGTSIAKQVGNLHEKNAFAANGSNLKTSFKTLAKADETIDLLNNVIGRSIGEANPDAGMQELALKTLDHYKENGLWTANPVTNSKGAITGYTIAQTKLSQEQYDKAKDIIQGLNNNGFTQPEQEKRDIDVQKEIQSNRGPKL